MFTTPKTLLKTLSAGSILTLAAACAQPQPVPIVADMYFDKFSAAQSAENGVPFCDLNSDDFTPELVAQIRSNPNYDRNLAIWLEECPELALAFADYGTASIASPAAGRRDSGLNSGRLGGGGKVKVKDNPKPNSKPSPKPDPKPKPDHKPKPDRKPKV